MEAPEPKRRTLQLIVAEGCNLACDYCFEVNKKHAFMEFETAVSAVEHYLTNDPEYDEVMIDFMGGEPMLAFPLIQRVVKHVLDRRWKKNFGFSMSTNGTLFNDENRTWLREHSKVFTPMLSFDGTKIAHDMNRSKSFDLVEANIAFLREYWPKQGFKMTVNNRSLPYLADGVLSILARGCIVDANLIYEDVWGDAAEKEKHLRILERQLARLVDFYTEFPKLDPPDLLTLPIVSCLSPVEREAWCGAGTAMVAIDRHGTRYPCHRFMNFSAGKSVTQQQFASLGKEAKENPQCAGCVVNQACPTCQACNWQYTGNTLHRVAFNCEMLKLQMVATAALQLNRIKARYSAAKPASIEAKELASMGRTLDAVRFIFKTLASSPRNELRPYVKGDWPGGKNWEKRVRWNET